MRALPLLALLAGAAPPTADAQPVTVDTLAFERVGERAIDAYDLAFDGDTLWAGGSRLYRLPPGGAAWEEVYDRGRTYVLPLNADTLLISGGVRRSTDGGATFVEVYDEGGRLFEAASGALLTGTRVGSGLAYSHDRGATWAEGALVGGPGAWSPWGEAFAEVPVGRPHAGRLVGAHWPGGLSYSDDGGATWQKASLWGARYDALDVAAGVDGRVYAALFEEGVAGLQVAASEDGGATYTPTYRFTTPGGFGARLVAVAGGSDPAVGVLLLVRKDGSVHRSDDATASWRQVGQVPFGDETDLMHDAVAGPEGRLYVAGGRIGTDEEWVYRTTEPVVVAAVALEAEPVGGPVVIGPGGGAFAFTVTLTNTTGGPLTGQAWSEVSGPLTLSPLLGPVPVTLGPGATLTRTLTQRVPAAAPAGTYTYTVNVGRFPGLVASSDAFAVVKAAGGGASDGRALAEAEGWSVSRWDEPAEAVSAPEPGGVALGVVPNPTRGEATVTLVLPEPAAVSVGAYDVVGRRVAVLHEGPLAAGPHAFALDGAALAPGLYVLRAEGGAVATRTVTRLR